MSDLRTSGEEQQLLGNQGDGQVRGQRDGGHVQELATVIFTPETDNGDLFTLQHRTDRLQVEAGGTPPILPWPIRRSTRAESTLSGLTMRNFITAARENGYVVSIAFLFVDSADVCVARVSERVRKGGHPVPEPDVRRRFPRAAINFWTVYREMADNWVLLYNGDTAMQDVEDVFDIPGRGLIVVPGPLVDSFASPGQIAVVLKRPDGQEVESTASITFHFQTPPPKEYRYAVILKGLAKADVPIGTDIWFTIDDDN